MTSPRPLKYGIRRKAPRLNTFGYRGAYRYFVTITAYMENHTFRDGDIVNICVAALSEVAGIHKFDVLCYCFMPEHLHVLLEGQEESNLREFVRVFKQKSSYRYKLSKAERLWQRGYHDRVLRDDEATLSVARYILSNPVRRGLTSEPGAYAYSGSFVCPVEEILHAIQVART